MAIERKFVADNIKKMQIKEYMEKELDRAGCGSIEIQRTPMGTRVIVNAQRPGLVIGRKGQAIRKLTNVLKKRYGLNNPQIEVNELQVPELSASVMAEGVASAIERGIHFRRAAYTGLRKIMEAGARGAEICISGKITGERSKSVKFLDGYLKHCGEPAIKYVDHGLAQAQPKQGVLGVRVKIMPPGIKLPDDITFIDPKKDEPDEDEAKKVVKTTEDIEELVEDLQEEVGVDEKTPKKIKVEQVKRKAAKKKPEEVLDEIEAEKTEEKPKKKAAKKKAVKKEAPPKEDKKAEVKETAPAKKKAVPKKEAKAKVEEKEVAKAEGKKAPAKKKAAPKKETKAKAEGKKAPAKKKAAPKKESKSKTDVKEKPAKKATKKSETPKEKK